MKKSSVVAAFGFLWLASLSPLAAAAPMIERGIDVFTTVADGKTFYDFSRDPIPAGFFCRDSKPFKGRIEFKGLPVATEIPGQLGSADTVVERLDDAVFDSKGTATTRLQFRALSLASTAPIKTSCGAFHAYVSLAGRQRVTTMLIHRMQEGGGSFVAPLAADVRLTFIPVKAGKNPRKLELRQRFTFPATSLPWSFARGTKGRDSVVVDTDGDLIPDSRVPGLSNFAAGLKPRASSKEWVPCCWEYVCHSDEGHQHCSWQFPADCVGECPVPNPGAR